MKTLLIIVIVICPLNLFAQSGNYEETFSFGFQIGYLIPENTGSGGHSSLVPGLEYRPSIHYKISKTLTPFLEFSYSKLKYNSEEKENRSVTFQTLNLGFKIYPNSNRDFYFKPAITFTLNSEWHIRALANINLELGKEFKISDELDVFGEGGIFLRNTEYSISYSISLGLNYKFL